MRIAGLIVVAVMVAACSGGPGATGAPTTASRAPLAGGTSAPASAAPGTTAEASAAPGTDAAASAASTQAGGGGINLMSLRPSGAKLRIANLYRDASGKPTDLDIY